MHKYESLAQFLHGFDYIPHIGTLESEINKNGSSL
jgi:hypothetical protein